MKWRKIRAITPFKVIQCHLLSSGSREIEHIIIDLLCVYITRKLQTLETYYERINNTEEVFIRRHVWWSFNEIRFLNVAHQTVQTSKISFIIRRSLQSSIMMYIVQTSKDSQIQLQLHHIQQNTWPRHLLLHTHGDFTRWHTDKDWHAWLAARGRAIRSIIVNVTTMDIALVLVLISVVLLTSLFSSQTTSRSVQPFSQGSGSWQTDRPTDRPWYSVCNNRPHLASAAIRPHNCWH